MKEKIPLYIFVFLFMLLVISFGVSFTCSNEVSACHDSVGTLMENISETNDYVWYWYDVAQKYSPYDKDVCWLKLHNGATPRIMKVRVINHTLPTYFMDENRTWKEYFGECTRLYEICHNPCWWDNRTWSCNCDVGLLANATELWELGYNGRTD